MSRKSAALIVSNALVVVILALVPATFAAQGGKPGPPGGGGGGGTASVNVSPNPAPADGARVDLTGCGYEVKVAEIRIEHAAGYTETYVNGVWSDGCMNPTYFLTREAGTYTVNMYQAGGNKRHPTPVLKASATLTVG